MSKATFGGAVSSLFGAVITSANAVGKVALMVDKSAEAGVELAEAGRITAENFRYGVEVSSMSNRAVLDAQLEAVKLAIANGTYKAEIPQMPA